MLDKLHMDLLSILQSVIVSTAESCAQDGEFPEDVKTHFSNAHYLQGLGEIKSPIERMMICAIAFQLECYGIAGKLTDDQLDPYRLIVVPQGAVGKWRADFLITYRLPRPIMLAVECDGHNFHDKTKAQAKRDKARDREFLSRGITPVRFAGSEIYASASDCVQQLNELLQNEFDHQSGWKKAAS